MVSWYFLSTQESDHPQIYTSVSRHPDGHMGVFNFIRHAFFIKWENSEIDAPELF